MRLHFAAVLVLGVLALSACALLQNSKNGSTGQSSDGAAMSAAARETPEDGVTMKEGAMLMLKDGEMSRMEQDVTMEDGTTVMMNGTVTLADGTALVLPEGMMVTMDGRLRMRDGFASAQEPAVMEGPSDDAAPAAAVSASYEAYTDAVLQDGNVKVLFFHAAWCPECKRHDGVLQSWLPSEEFTRSVYKVDYDTAKELKAKFGVVYQHTFVVVDGQGNKISSKQGPTEAELKAMLQ